MKREESGLEDRRRWMDGVREREEIAGDHLGMVDRQKAKRLEIEEHGWEGSIRP